MLGVHIAAATLFAAVNVPFRVALDLLVPIPGKPPSTLAYLFGFYSATLFARGILIYGIFLALSHAARYYRDFLRQAQLTAELQNKVAELLADTEVKPDSKYSDRFILRESGRIFPIPVGQIDWIEAAGNYVALHVSGKTHLLRDSMASMEQKLDPKAFVRIRRSVIVQIDRIEELRTLPGGRFAALLRGGSQVTLGRPGIERLDNLIEQLTFKQQASASS
jgi:DNA-binding LytR/AlgR family response regulator